MNNEKRSLGNSRRTSTKKNISSLFDEALRSINDMSNLIPLEDPMPFTIPSNPMTYLNMWQFSQYHPFNQFPMYNPSPTNFIKPINSKADGNLSKEILKAVANQESNKKEAKEVEEVNDNKEMSVRKEQRKLNERQVFSPKESIKVTSFNVTLPLLKSEEHIQTVPRVRQLKPSADNIPISHTGKTFEELLEEKLKEDPFNHNMNRPVKKKQFLKRKSNQIKPAPTKKFTYYSDKVSKENVPAEIDKNIEVSIPKKRSISQAFLTKGKGTGGGIGNTNTHDKKIENNQEGEINEIRTSVAEFKRLEQQCQRPTLEKNEEDKNSICEIQSDGETCNKTEDKLKVLFYYNFKGT